MLKGIPAIIPPELMKILMEMGHGDELLICDGNYPKFGCPERCVRMDGHGIPEILDAILKTACGRLRCRNRSFTRGAQSAMPVSQPAKRRCTPTSS